MSLKNFKTIDVHTNSLYLFHIEEFVKHKQIGIDFSVLYKIKIKAVLFICSMSLVKTMKNTGLSKEIVILTLFSSRGCCNHPRRKSNSTLKVEGGDQMPDSTNMLKQTAVICL